MTRFISRSVLFALVALIARLSAAQQPQAAPAVTAEPDMITRIFTGEFNERPAPVPRWFEGGRAYISMEPASGVGRDLVKFDTATGTKLEVLITAGQMIPEGAKEPLRVENFSWSGDGRRALLFTNAKRVWRTNSRGDYWFFDRSTGKMKKLGGDAREASLMYAKFSPDARKVAYVKQNDIYVEDLASGEIRRLTRDGGDLVVNGGSDWVNEEELGIHDAFWWSPDGKRIAFLQFDLHGVGNFPLMYYLGEEREVVTQIPYPMTGPYPAIMNVPYPLAGTTNSAVRAGILDVASGNPKWLSIPGDPRDNYIARVQWVDTKTLLIQHLNRLQNTEDYYIADPDGGTVRSIWEDKDEAFISIGYGGLLEARPIEDGAEFLTASERDGWMHIYRVRRDSRATLVTRGDMDTAGIAGIDAKGGWLYFIASPSNATQRYLYRSALDGKSDPVRITPTNFTGTNSYNISPDAQYAFHTFSSFDDPGECELVSLPDHKPVRPWSDNAELERKIAAAFPNPPVEFFKVDAGDGVAVDGWVVKPPHFDASKKYPVLVQVYGEPAGQTVADRWGARRALYHRYVAGLGYLVVSFDNSGTPAPRGRTWRKSIYGTVGVLSSKQQAHALRSFGKTHPYADLDRVAVWGWSGGGTNTLNLMFRSPDLYKAGMAVAPVPDQRLYDSIYQERYMGLPQQNSKGYQEGSAINFAEGLEGHLLIVHGSGDDNVHFQGTELLVNRLIQLGKVFDEMVYPDRTHSISEGPGTTVHLYHLLTRYLTDHLPAGGR